MRKNKNCLVEDNMTAADMFRDIGSGAILQYDFGDSMYISLKRIPAPEYFDEELDDYEEFGLLESLRDRRTESQ